MPRSSLSTLVVLLALAASGWAAPAEAATTPRARRVVLLETPAALERALRTALMPWGMRVARSQTRSQPGAPKSTEQARSLARRLRADALVWLAPALQRHELWLYDGSNGTLTTRNVPAPPFDETRAAALALSVKTELRKGTLAGAAPVAVSDVAAKLVVPVAKETPAAQPPAAAAATPAVDPADAPPDPDSTLTSQRASEPEPPAPPRPARAPSPELDSASSPWAARDASDVPSWKLLLHAAARRGASSLGGTEARYAVEGRWAPWADPAEFATLWLGARFDMGLPRAVETETFTGEYAELGGGLGLGGSVRASHWLALGMQIGAGLRTATLSGTLTDGVRGERTRRGLELHVRPEIELSFEPLGVVIQPALGVAPLRQRYRADSVEVLETHAIWWQLGAGVRVLLD